MTAPAKRKPGRPRKTPPAQDGDEVIDPREEFGETPSALPDLDAQWLDIMGDTPAPEPRPAVLPPPAFIDKLHIDSRVSTIKLVAMARHFNVRLEERWITQTLAHMGLSAERGRGFELLPALFGLIEHFKHKADKNYKADPEKDRTKKANAGMAELRFMELAKETVPLAAAKQFWSDARTELRKTVELATYLTAEQKKELLQDFQRLKAKLEVENKQ